VGRTSSVKLAHFGRKTGKRFVARVWFIETDGVVWIGSLDIERNWVRNLEASGRAELDFGQGPSAYIATRCHDLAQMQRFRSAVEAKHPILSRIIASLTRGKTAGCFRLEPAQTAQGEQGTA
jgi:hypothetical protein